MANYQDYFRSKDFLAAADLQGRDVTLRIRQVTPETVDGDAGKETALIVRFERTEKKLRLNRTNANSIAALANTQDFDRWVGMTITLFPTSVEFRGAMKDAIRVRPNVAAPAAPAPPPPPVATALPDDDIPF